MIARLMCKLLGHVFEKLDEYEGVQRGVFVKRGTCARCAEPILVVDDRRPPLDG